MTNLNVQHDKPQMDSGSGLKRETDFLGMTDLGNEIAPEICLN
jgi:hypothetical protein